MAKMREINKRMVAVRNIQRITKTMQMIATAKFTAAVARTKATKPYAAKIRQLVAEVAAAAGDVEHPLIDGPAERADRRFALVITSDRGLCGAYNAHVFRTALEHLRQTPARTEQHLETVGKKAAGFFKFQKIDVAARHFYGDKPVYEDVEEWTSRLIDEFVAGHYDAVDIIFMRFESNARQVPTILPLLPMKPPTEDHEAADGRPHANYEFSPSSAELLADLLPMAIKTAVFQAINEAIVSEQVMRMIAMKAATENAKDLGKTLRRSYNRARQSQITTELSEIISGAAALD